MKLMSVDDLYYEDVECTDGNTYSVVHATEIDKADVFDLEEHDKEVISKFMSWLCDKYEVFESEDDGYTLYRDMKYHSKEELLDEFKIEIGIK